VSTYRVEFSNHSGDHADFDVDPYNEGDEIGPIVVGEWTIAAIGTNASGNAIAAGVPDDGNPVTISTGSNSANVTLEPIDRGRGSLTYSVTFPSVEVDDVIVTMDPLPVGGGDSFTLTAGTDYNDGFATSGTLAIDTTQDSGEHLLSIVFSKTVDNEPIDHPPLLEVVHLLDGLTCSESVTVTSEDFTQPPGAPADLEATPISGTEIELTWTDESILESSFEIQRGTDSEFASATTLTAGANETTYTDSALPNDGTWYYRVAAVNSFGASDPSTATSTEIVFPHHDPCAKLERRGY